jgi:hypothetical protein
MDDIRLRLTRLTREFVSEHLPPLLGLLAEEGVPRDEQVRRADRLVRALLEFEIRPGLSDGTRRRPVALEPGDGEDAPERRVAFNPDLIGEEVGDGDILSLLEEPVTHCLDLSPMKAGLVLQIQDDERLTSLYKRASREAGIEPVSTVDIPSVVEEKFRLLEERSAELAIALTGQAFEPHGELDLDLEAFMERLEGRWPGWDELRSNDFIDSLVDRVELILRDYDAVPEPEMLVELCWESLELSSQSFIRHAARELRALHHDVLDVQEILEDLADIVAEQEGGVPDELSEWDVFSEIGEIWDELFRTEQRVLAWSTEGRATPSISVFEPPLETFHLDQPDSLPWDYPLLCWSLRERQALRDLLEGHCQTIAQKAPDRPEVVSAQLDERGTNDTLGRAAAPDDIAMSVAAFQVESEAERQFRIERAMRANYNKLLGSFRSLDASRQHDVLQRLRAGYDGYFGDSQIVWDRRFEAWERLDEEDAFRLLSTELQNLVGPASIYDPFEAADDASTRRVPLFEFLVAWPEDGRKATVRIPLVTLESTFEHAPVRIRFVEVPEADEEACRWLGDRELVLRTLVDQPTEELLRSVQNDAIGLMFERS